MAEKQASSPPHFPTNDKEMADLSPTRITTIIPYPETTIPRLPLPGC